MYSGRDFSDAAPSEVQTFSFDFTRALPSEGFIANASWFVEVVSGIDDDAGLRLIGDPEVDGPVTSQRIGGLLDGVRYRLVALALASDGQTREMFSHVRCRARR